MEKHLTARLAALPEDYQRLGIQPRTILPWEDGHRTHGKLGEYEWWYFDMRLEDGSSLVIVFYTQPVTAIAPGYAPSVTLSYTRGDFHLSDSAAFSVKDCSFDREGCNVRLGKCRVGGDLKEYTIHYETDHVKADVKLNASVSAWRPESGHFLFDEKDYFAWLPSVPEGKVEVRLNAEGITRTLNGTGYHDHNWGNQGMFWLMHHWYWGRAKVGPYQVISSYITAHKKFGCEHFPIFLLAKEGQKLADDPRFLTYTQSEPAYDPVTEKHYHRTLVYDYDNGRRHYRITYRQQDIIEYFTVSDSKNAVQARSNPLQLALVKLAGLAPSYIRMTGTVTLERFEGGEIAERHEAPGLWEMMYFGVDEDI